MSEILELGAGNVKLSYFQKSIVWCVIPYIIYINFIDGTFDVSTESLEITDPVPVPKAKAVVDKLELEGTKWWTTLPAVVSLL